MAIRVVWKNYHNQMLPTMGGANHIPTTRSMDSWGGLPAPPDPPTFFVGRSRGLHEFSWKIHGFPWVPMGPMGPHGVPMGSPWLPWEIQECRKSSILMKTTIRFDRIDEARGPVRCAIFFRSILSRQNPLNRHMEQNIYFLPENPVFQFFGLEIPYRTSYFVQKCLC